MKLEVGMYVRGKYYQYRGKIGKIIKNYNNDLEIAYKDGILKTNVGSFIDDNYDVNGKQYKASYNIIDILEVGDYVNGERIINIIPIDICGNEILDNQHIFTKDGEIFENEIKSIVTKEQFEQMSYEIIEKDKII